MRDIWKNPFENEIASGHTLCLNIFAGSSRYRFWVWWEYKCSFATTQLELTVEREEALWERIE